MLTYLYTYTYTYILRHFGIFLILVLTGVCSTTAKYYIAISILAGRSILHSITTLPLNH